MPRVSNYGILMMYNVIVHPETAAGHGAAAAGDRHLLLRSKTPNTMQSDMTAMENTALQQHTQQISWRWRRQNVLRSAHDATRDERRACNIPRGGSGRMWFGCSPSCAMSAGPAAHPRVQASRI